jgi:hypothetical protein
MSSGLAITGANPDAHTSANTDRAALVGDDGIGTRITIRDIKLQKPLEGLPQCVQRGQGGRVIAVAGRSGRGRARYSHTFHGTQRSFLFSTVGLLPEPVSTPLQHGGLLLSTANRFLTLRSCAACSGELSKYKPDIHWLVPAILYQRDFYLPAYWDQEPTRVVFISIKADNFTRVF